MKRNGFKSRLPYMDRIISWLIAGLHPSQIVGQGSFSIQLSFYLIFVVSSFKEKEKKNKNSWFSIGEPLLANRSMRPHLGIQRLGVFPAKVAFNYIKVAQQFRIDFE